MGVGLGFQVTEKVWKAGPMTLEIEDATGGAKSFVKLPVAWTFDKFKSIDPRTINLHVDPTTDEWNGVSQQQAAVSTPAIGGEIVGPERVALFTHAKDDNFGRLTGYPNFNNSFIPWWDKSAIGMYANNYFETKGDPSMVGRASLDAIRDSDGVDRDGLSFMAGILRSIKSGAGVVLPSDRDENGNYKYDVSFLTAEKVGDQFESYLRYKGEQILQGQLVPPRVGGAHAGSGLGTKDAGVQADQHAEFQEAILKDFFDYLNEQYVKPLVIYNFGLAAWEESKTSLVVSGLSAGMKMLLRDILFKCFDQESSLGSGKSVPLFKRADCAGIMKQLDVPQPSAEEMAELEKEQEQINEEAAQQMADLAAGAPPPKGSAGDSSGDPNSNQD